MDDILYKRKTLLQELYTILLSPSPDKEGGGTSAFSPLSSLGAGPYIDNIVLNIVNNHQSNIEWEKILHKIRGKYSYTFQSCDKAMELWIELLNTSINGWHESVTEDGKAYWWRKGMDAKIDIQWENPTKYQSSATTATEQEGPEEEISSETSDYATQFHAKFSEMQRKMQRNKPLEAALSRSNHHKPTEKKVSKIKFNNEENDLNDPPRYIPESKVDKKYIKSSRNIDIYSSLSNKKITIKSLFDNQNTTDNYSKISKRIGKLLEVIDKGNYPRMIRKSSVRYNDNGLPIIPNIILYIDGIKITTDVVVDDSIATDIIIFNNDIKTLEEEMGIFISDDLRSNEADFSDDY